MKTIDKRMEDVVNQCQSTSNLAVNSLQEVIKLLA